MWHKLAWAKRYTIKTTFKGEKIPSTLTLQTISVIGEDWAPVPGLQLPHSSSQSCSGCPSAFVIGWNCTTQGLESGITWDHQRGQMTHSESQGVNYDHWESRDGREPGRLTSSLSMGCSEARLPLEAFETTPVFLSEHLPGCLQCLLVASCEAVAVPKHHNTLLPIFPASLSFPFLPSLLVVAWILFFSPHCPRVCTSQVNSHHSDLCLQLCCLETLSFMPSFAFRCQIWVCIFVYTGEGNGNPLQYSCLENSMDRGAWLATVHGVPKNQTQLSD